MKTQLKIALFLIVSNTVLLLLFGIGVYYFLANYSYSDFYKRLETRASLISKYQFNKNDDDLKSLKKIKEEHFEKLRNEKEFVLKLTNNKLSESIIKKNKIPNSLIQKIISQGKASEQENKTFYFGKIHFEGKSKYLIIISAENYYATHHLALLRTIILIGISFIIIITISLSFYFSKHIFDPIKRITDEVKTISTDKIHLRLEETKNDNEINQLIFTFNDLLNRIETSFETQKNFISNASHEFGTPLTSIIGEADVALMKKREPEEYKTALTNILNQAERLNQISQTLLLLAQTGYKENSLKYKIVRSDELVIEAKELLDKLIPTNKIQLDFSLLPENPYKLKIQANKQLLILAFVNILSNACKYSKNKFVSFSVAATNNEVIFIIIDNGIGIPNEELKFIYDPFFRASNTTNFEGYGIGLPLSRNIIHLHHGKLILSSIINEGTTVQIKIPLVKF